MLQQKQIDQLKPAFLEKGGIYLRKGINKQNEPIIEQMTKFKTNWHTRLTFTSEQLRDKNFNNLTRKRKLFFKAY